MSADLLWELTKNHNSFLYKKNLNGSRFTREAGNVMNIHSYKFSGLANAETVSIEGKDKKFTVLTKTRHAGSKPSRQFQRATTGKAYRAVGAVRGSEKRFVRRDLTRLALARVCKLKASFKKSA